MSSPLDLEALVVLHGTTRPLTGRDVARLAGRGSQRGLLAALHRLSDYGLVHVEEAGNALLYTLNRDHLAAPALDVLLDMRAGLERRVEGSIAGWDSKPVHASIFGSAARGDGDTTSDIDLFIVRPDDVGEADEMWRAQLDRLAADVRGWTGNNLAVSEVAEHELNRLRRRPPPIVRELRAHAVTVFGSQPALLFGGAR